MCNCKNIEIGSYGNQVELTRPAHMGEGNAICVDRCLEEEIKYLWSLEITTTGCCCGHNKQVGYIGVIDEDIQVMKGIGYMVRFNKSRPNDEDSFIPKFINHGTEIRKDVFGYFDDPASGIPTFDPGMNGICLVCGKVLKSPVKTISLMKDGSSRSYFYRTHKDCYENIDAKELTSLEEVLIDNPNYGNHSPANSNVHPLFQEILKPFNPQHP